MTEEDPTIAGLEAELEKVTRGRDLARDESKYKSAFLSNMSHELRTPLNAIIGFTQLLKSGEFEEKSQEYLDDIEQSGAHLLRLVNELLDISKIEANGLDTHEQDASVQTVLYSPLSMIKEQYTEKGIGLLINQPPGEMSDYITADVSRVQQVILNLLSNSLKFTDKGKITYSVSIEDLYHKNPIHKDRFIVVSVSDTGKGIHEDKIDVIFNPYMQEDSLIARKYGGTGLGLSLSRTLAENMGGRLYIKKSEPGKGSTFVFELPYKPADKPK